MKLELLTNDDKGGAELSQWGTKVHGEGGSQSWYLLPFIGVGLKATPTQLLRGKMPRGAVTARLGHSCAVPWHVVSAFEKFPSGVLSTL